MNIFNPYFSFEDIIEENYEDADDNRRPNQFQMQEFDIPEDGVSMIVCGAIALHHSSQDDYHSANYILQTRKGNIFETFSVSTLPINSSWADFNNNICSQIQEQQVSPSSCSNRVEQLETPVEFCNPLVSTWNAFLHIQNQGKLGIGHISNQHHAIGFFVQDIANKPRIKFHLSQFCADLVELIKCLMEYPEMSIEKLVIQIQTIRSSKISKFFQTQPLVQFFKMDAKEDVIYVFPTLNFNIEKESTDEAIKIWENEFNLTYSKLKDGDDMLIGWKSSVTGEPIPNTEMEEWLTNIVNEIRTLNPKNVLEIGCGTGNLLRCLLPFVESYHGTDFSDETIKYLETSLQNSTIRDSASIRLTTREASEFDQNEIELYDTIVINSVVQYFPSIDYLEKVLTNGLQLLKPGGYIFIGDVRNFESIEAFHASILLKQTTDIDTITEFKLKVQERMQKDFELLVHPAFFQEFVKKIKNGEPSSAKSILHRGKYDNELISYRFNTVIQKGKCETQIHLKTLKWEGSRLQGVDHIQNFLKVDKEFCVTGIPNARLLIGFALREINNFSKVDELRQWIQNFGTQFVDPEEFAQIGEKFGFNVKILPSNFEFCFDILFLQTNSMVMNYNYKIDNESFNSLSLASNPCKAKEWYSIWSRLTLSLKYFLQKYDYKGKIPRIQLLDHDKQILDKVEVQPCSGTLLKLFEINVRHRNPKNLCIVSEIEKLSYEDVNNRADALTVLLRTTLKDDETFVAIILPPSTNFLISSLAILKMGKAILPISVDFAQIQIEDIITEVEDPLVITTHEVLDAISGLQPRRCFFIDDVDIAIPSPTQNLKKSKIRSTDLAYLIFTSGTTGKPKGVLLEHGSTVNYIKWITKVTEVQSSDSCVFVSNPAFDGSFVDYWQLWCGGGCVYVPPPIMRYDSAQLITYMKENNITTLNRATPLIENFLQELSVNALKKLKWIICGGEGFRKFPTEWISRYKILLCYGPTETTSTATSVILGASHEKSPTVGQPIDNVQVYILDDEMKPIYDANIRGEIYIGGVGLCRGYFKKPKLTAEKFIQSPFNSSLLYRTGDFGYFLQNRDLVLDGREDALVKVRGFRLSLTEVELALSVHPDIRQVVVLAQQSDSTSFLVAYCTLNSSVNYKQPPTLEHVRHFLRQKIPHYAMPSEIHFLPEFPLTPNGKINKKVLQQRIHSSQAALHQVSDLDERLNDERFNDEPINDEPLNEKEIVKNEIEAFLVSAWSEVLKIPIIEINIRSNFFELGGYSLLVPKLILVIKEKYATELPFNILLDYSTIGSLTTKIYDIISTTI